MGSSEMSKGRKRKEKEPKIPPTTSQEQPSTTSSGATNPDWSNFQAYPPIPPHGYMASNPHAHPYMWGVQHVMPPYGTAPHPYMAMVPPGGMYAHPSMPPVSYPFSPFPMAASNGIAEAGNVPSVMGSDAKTPEVKDKLPIKRSKGSSGGSDIITGKNNECSKTPKMSTNGNHPKSGESTSKDTSDGSDTNSQDDHEFRLEGRQNSLEVYTPQNGGVNSHYRMVNQPMPISVAGAAGVVPGPTTNLNIGMDYWGAQTSTIPGRHGKVSSAAVAEGMVTGGFQDERELKRQKRKQSNRESARRSRLRKQAEYEEIAQRADAMKEENASLRSELSQIRSMCDKLLSENAALKERLGESPGNCKELMSSSNDESVSDGDEPQQTEQEEDVKDAH